MKVKVARKHISWTDHNSVLCEASKGDVIDVKPSLAEYWLKVGTVVKVTAKKTVKK